MVPKLLFFLVPAALFVVSALLVAFWGRPSKSPKAENGDGDSEGAFRAFYHLLWVLILWTGLCLSLPLWISYKEKIIASTMMADRWPLVGRVLVLPIVLLLLLWYGGRQGYLKWIDSLYWPDEENK